MCRKLPPASSSRQFCLASVRALLNTTACATASLSHQPGLLRRRPASHRKSSGCMSDMPTAQQRTLRRIVKGEASGWLTVLPLQADGYDLSATQFRDQLAIRYHHEPAGLPAVCDGCGAPFSLQHGLGCAKVGLMKKGQNDLQDSDARLADLAWGGVEVELYSFRRVIAAAGRCFRQIGWHEAFGRETGWRSLTIASPMLTHPDMSSRICPGRLLPNVMYQLKLMFLLADAALSRRHNYTVCFMRSLPASSVVIKSVVLFGFQSE